MKKIVIFDMDGTLIDSKKDITLSINYVRKKNHNLPPLSESFVVEAINMYERNLPYLFYQTQTYQADDKAMFEEHYKKQCIQNVYLYEGVAEMLKKFADENVMMGVATNAPTLFAKTMLHHLHVDHFFTYIVGADKVAHSKPSPDMLELILKECHYNPKNDKSWMVGDNSKDMESAHNAGIDAIFAAWGFSTCGTYSVVAYSPKEVLEIVL